MIFLGLDLNCFTNRFIEPDDWTARVAELGVRHVQFNADLLDPMLPWNIQERVIRETRRWCEERGIAIHSSFGGNHHHQNYLGHPDDAIASWYQNFYERLIRQTALLGGAGVGTCFAIMTVRDARQRRQAILCRAAEAYLRLAQVARDHGLQYLLFEISSVPRESCATFEETDQVLEMLRAAAVSMRLCLDVGHRNVTDPHPPEASPYEWIRRYGKRAPVIHIQQCNSTGSHHWPFTQDYNAQGDVHPADVLAAVRDSGARDVLLALEIKHKAFHPVEGKVIENLKASVEYWRRWVPI